jgi:acyl-CoA synthetase (AMP-forming)/AMP-acid ligase II
MITTTPTLIHHFLENSAQQYAGKVALIHQGVRSTYADINAQANQLAQHLCHCGVTYNQRVALLLENSLEYVVSYYGALKTGAVVVSLSSDSKPENLKDLLVEVEPSVLISSARFERLLQSTNLGTTQVQHLILKSPQCTWSSAALPVHAWEDLMQVDRRIRNPQSTVAPDDLASIIYTSGSTGRAKGVMLSHRNIVSNTRAICQYLQLAHDDVQMVVLPFFYVMGKSLLNTHFAVGGTVVINNKFAFPISVLNEMVAEQVTGFSGVPSTYAYLLHRSPLAKFRDKLTSLRYCSQAGGHMSRTIKEKLRQVLPDHTQIYIMYGATEAAARLAFLDPECYAEKMDSIGKAIPGVTLRIVDTNGEEVPRGQVGELMATGPNIMHGYWKDPVATRKVLNGRWYHTGDETFQDDNGYFYVIGRKDDILKVGGHRINPTEVEDVLMELDIVVEAVVLGVQDPILEHKLVAFIVPKTSDCRAEHIWLHCAQRLPKYKLPKEIKLIQSLPKTSNGKVDRLKCLQLL